MRTYDRETYLEAKLAWERGRFGPEWNELRRLSWDGGFPYPPNGSAEDSREAENPSQRAIIYAALVDRPQNTTEIVARARSWSMVVAGILGTEERLREDADLADKEAELTRSERPTHREAASSIAFVLERIAASRGLPID